MASETDAAAYDTAEAHGVAGAGGVAADARAELERLRAPLAAAGLGLGVALASDPAARPAGPAEAAAAAGMIPDRRREFLAGRLAARRALRSVGLTCGDVPRAGRRPVFPPGYAASITHDAGIAVAVARPPGHTGPAGCDLELGRFPLEAARLVLREDEEAWLHDAGPALAPARLRAVFSAKEAAWKALYGAQGSAEARTLRDLCAVPEPGGGFRVRPRGDGGSGVVRVCVCPVAGGVFSWVRPAREHGR
ncbi:MULTISPECIES: 4'-phosphopantetheinyl transferase family protein [unclassified Streptomyces]|uniref:4'-phosphopantetheinyl transferase family protein n=1 Tax=unclassified Streptomyces TaxID=2593676 RepID=UPI000A75BF10|nr:MULTISPECIES: 4'-phosphopantetheinyl transferase superfamily protein [unclassified Streptomyces]